MRAIFGNASKLALLVGTTLVVSGCLGGEETVEPVSFTPVKKEQFIPNALAGIPAQEIQDPNAYKKVVASASIPPARRDPFALTSMERAFDVQQLGERMFTEQGTFNLEYTPPPPPSASIPTLEPQPYRRLSGVVVGDSVLAIIEMGQGQPPQIVRPGQRIPNSEWTVVSIDENKAVLRRAGNKLPKEIIVRLESPPPGMGGGGGTPPGGGGAGAPGTPGMGGGRGGGGRMGGGPAGAGGAGGLSGDR